MEQHDRITTSHANSVLRAALAQEPGGWHELDDILRRLASSVARRFGIDKRGRADFVEVVSQDVALAVLEAGPGGFDETRGGAMTWLWRITQAKASRYIAAIPAVGRRRPKKSKAPANRGRQRVRSLGDEHSESLVDPDVAREFELVAARHDAEVLLAKAPPKVARALRAVHWDGWSLAAVAEDLGIDRTTFSRRVEAFRGRMCEAAVA